MAQTVTTGEKRILIVEDDRGLSNILHDIFTKEGFKVSVAFDGETGLSKALSELPHLIILDIQIPRMRGTELLKKLRENSDGAKIHVIAVTNLDDEETVSKILEGNVTNYFVKADLNLSDVIAKTKEILHM